MPHLNVETLTPITGPGIQTRLNEEEEQALLKVLREANSLGIGGNGGPENNAFESDFTAYTGCADAVAVNSCSSALEMADSHFVVDGFSKRYAMTGFRLGWMVVPEWAVRPAQIALQNLEEIQAAIQKAKVASKERVEARLSRA